jgi:ABC-2 type transport system permease protein
MTTLVTHSTRLTVRSVRQLVRQPAFVVSTLVQPAIWLFLFGQLFKDVIEIPGFAPAGTTYLEFLTPGVIAMTVIFSATWAGTVYVQDMERGVMDRLLASPVSRGAMMNGTLAYQSIVTMAQAGIILALAVVAGARYDGGALGVVLTLFAAVLLTVVFASLSNALALLTRQQESLIGISQLLSLPMAFLSSAIMNIRLAPVWIQTIAKYNPMDWCVVVARQTLSSTPDWGAVWPRLAALVALAIVMGWLATRAFAAYQRSS